jgi:hypothetical protein
LWTNQRIQDHFLYFLLQDSIFLHASLQPPIEAEKIYAAEIEREKYINLDIDVE